MNYRSKILGLLFLLSGSSAILYEILWVRLLSLALGGVTLVIASISALFLSGLALGGFLGGKLADRERESGQFLFWLYAAVELLVAVLGVANWQVFSQFTLQAREGRFLVAGILVLLQATAVGATWPLMLKLLLSLGGSLSVVGRIAFLNTFGAALGAFLAGFLLLANFGITGSVSVAVIGNLIAGLGVAMIGVTTKLKKFKGAIGPLRWGQKTLPKGEPFPKKRAFLILALAGFLGMGMEIFWLRAFALVIGNSIYAFTLVLTVILLGLALGGLIVERLPSATIIYSKMVWLLLIEAIFILLGMILLPKIPSLLVSWQGQGERNFIQEELRGILLVSLVTLVPSLLSGMFLPWGVRLWRSNFAVAGHESGFVYFVNTAGSVLGGLLAAIVIMPALGLQMGIVLLVVIATATFFLFSLTMQKPLLLPFSAVLMVIGLSFVAYKNWDRQVLTSGAWFFGGSVLEKNSGIKLTSYQDGVEATVTTTWQKGITTLVINGKPDASTDTDMDTQTLLGDLPMLLHRESKNVLVIGLGSGVTAGVISRYSGVERVTVAEIEKAVVEVAGKYFRDQNFDVLNNPKVNLFIGDGRDFLLNSSQKFDVISSEPSNPWVVGNASLFTHEFFQIGRNHLSDHGVFFQWVQLYNLRPEEFKTVVKTFQSVFPYVQLWISRNQNDVFLAGQMVPFEYNWQRLTQESVKTETLESLKRIGLDDRLRLVSLFWCGNKELEKLSQGGEVNSDNRPVLEYKAPFGLLSSYYYSDNVKLLLEYFQDEETIGLEGKALETVKKYRQARRLLYMATEQSGRGNLEKGIELGEQALVVDKESLSVKRFLADMYFFRAINNKGNVDNFRRAIDLNPQNYAVYLGLLHAYLGSPQDSSSLSKETIHKAQELIKQGEEKFPWSGEILLYEAILATINKDNPKAEELLLKAEELEPTNSLIHNGLGYFYLSLGKKEPAMEEFSKSLFLNTDQPNIKALMSSYGN